MGRRKEGGGGRGEEEGRRKEGGGGRGEEEVGRRKGGGGRGATYVNTASQSPNWNPLVMPEVAAQNTIH